MAPTEPSISERGPAPPEAELKQPMGSQDARWQVHDMQPEVAMCTTSGAQEGATCASDSLTRRWEGDDHAARTAAAACAAHATALCHAALPTVCSPESGCIIGEPTSRLKLGVKEVAGSCQPYDDKGILPLAQTNSWVVKLQMLSEPEEPPRNAMHELTGGPEQLSAEDVQVLMRNLAGCTQAGGYGLVVQLLQLMAALPITPELLAASQVGKHVRALARCTDPQVASTARHLVAFWEEMVLDALATNLKLPMDMRITVSPFPTGSQTGHVVKGATSQGHGTHNPQFCCSTPASEWPISSTGNAVTPAPNSMAAWGSPFAAASYTVQASMAGPEHPVSAADLCAAKDDAWQQPPHHVKCDDRTSMHTEEQHLGGVSISTHERVATRLQLLPLPTDGNHSHASHGQQPEAAEFSDASLAPACHTKQQFQQPPTTGSLQPLTLTAEQQQLLRQLSSADSVTLRADELLPMSAANGLSARKRRKVTSPTSTASALPGSSSRHAGCSVQSGRTPAWTEEETNTFLHVLKQHGRSYAKLMEALPHRPKDQIRNWFNNHKVKLHLDELLLSHGHPIKVKSDKSDVETHAKKSRTRSGPLPTCPPPVPATVHVPQSLPSRTFSMPLSPKTPIRPSANQVSSATSDDAYGRHECPAAPPLAPPPRSPPMPLPPAPPPPSARSPNSGAGHSTGLRHVPELQQVSQHKLNRKGSTSSCWSRAMLAPHQYTSLQPTPPNTPFQSWQSMGGCSNPAASMQLQSGRATSDVLLQMRSADARRNTCNQQGNPCIAADGVQSTTARRSGQLAPTHSHVAALYNSLHQDWAGYADSSRGGNVSLDATIQLLDSGRQHSPSRVSGRHGGMGVFSRSGPEGAVTSDDCYAAIATDDNTGIVDGLCPMPAAPLSALVPSSSSPMSDLYDNDMWLDVAMHVDDNLMLSMAGDDDGCMGLDMTDAAAGDLPCALAQDQQANGSSKANPAWALPAAAAVSLDTACMEPLLNMDVGCQRATVGGWPKDQQASSGSSTLAEDCFLA